MGKGGTPFNDHALVNADDPTPAYRRASEGLCLGALEHHYAFAQRLLSLLPVDCARFHRLQPLYGSQQSQPTPMGKPLVR